VTSDDGGYTGSLEIDYLVVLRRSFARTITGRSFPHP